MLKKFSSGLYFTLLLCLVTGCGFHLRGVFNIPDALKVIHIVPNQPYDPFQRALRQTLKTNAVQLVDAELAKASGAATLTILGHTISERTIAYGADGQPNRSLLTLTINYQLTDKNGKILVENGVAEIQRELAVNPNVVLGTDNERTRLKSEMILEGASQVVRQLSLVTL